MKKIISMVVLVGAVTVGAKICHEESAECALVFGWNQPSRAEGETLEVQLFEIGSSALIGQFRKHYSADGSVDVPARWPMKVPAGEYRLQGRLLGSPELSFEQTVTLANDKTIRIRVDEHWGR